MDPTNFQINIRSVSFDGWYCPNQLTYCYDERYIPKNSGINFFFVCVHTTYLFLNSTTILLNGFCEYATMSEHYTALEAGQPVLVNTV